MASYSTRPTLLTRTGTPTLGLSATTSISRANAHRMKLAGGGSTRTMVSQSTLGDLGGSIGSGIGGNTGGAIGTILGEGLDYLINRRSRPTSGGAGTSGLVAGAGPCPEGTIRAGDTCVDLMALPPGGSPATFPVSGVPVASGGAAVIGSFGIPARQPQTVSQLVRRCGRGMVLGDDNLCYPKAVLPRRSKFRKWRGDKRPPVSAADMAAIRKAASARDRVLELAKDVGLHASKSSPRRKK